VRLNPSSCGGLGLLAAYRPARAPIFGLQRFPLLLLVHLVKSGDIFGREITILKGLLTLITDGHFSAFLKCFHYFHRKPVGVQLKVYRVDVSDSVLANVF
jgi:hypothetical protein